MKRALLTGGSLNALAIHAEHERRDRIRGQLDAIVIGEDGVPFKYVQGTPRTDEFTITTTGGIVVGDHSRPHKILTPEKR